MTFSIAARDGDAWGVAVASKFLAVGSVVPAVRPGVGAVATQSLARVAYLAEVLDALAAGTPVDTALAGAVAADDGRAQRQVGAVGPTGAATFTGDGCLSWAGGVAAGDGHTAYAIQGNILTGRSSRTPRARATTAAVCSPTCGWTTTPMHRASWPACTTCPRCSSVAPRTSSRCRGH